MTTAEVRKEFGATVRKHRLRLGLSQETLAERAELHRTYVTDVERGARNLSLESITKLARGLGLSIGSLFWEPENSTSLANEAPATDLLLVQNEPEDIAITLDAFKEARLANRVEVVRDGVGALDYMFRRGPYAQRQPQTLPQLILLDLHLPKASGIDVLRGMRSSELFRSTHVVVLATSNKDANVREALRLGAAACIVKPLDFQSLTAVTPQLNFWWRLLQETA